MSTTAEASGNCGGPSCRRCGERLTRVGAFWICPTHGQQPEPGVVGPLRIFLSYGHDANEELVLRIKADLEERGHAVWIDRSEIKFGDDWRRAITDGILASNRVLSFLSKHSTREPGVCLDEIAIAIGVKGGNIQTILLESEAEVRPPASISHIQWLDMHEWREQHAAGPATWDRWYRAKFAEIVRVVESEESRRFAGEIATLEEKLKPITPDSRIAALLRTEFVGRAWLFEAVERWRNALDRSSRLFWATGEPGIGKSTFAAHLTHFGRDKVIAAQFVEWDKPDHRDARRIVRSLAFQMATRLPDYRRLLLTLPEVGELDSKDSAELFDYLLAKPLRSAIGGGRERYLVVIDALDEAGEGERNPLAELLARDALRLPKWIGLVVTSRPEATVTSPLQRLKPVHLDAHTEANRDDLRHYLRHQLAAQLTVRPSADRLLEQVITRSEGMFLYVAHFCEDVRLGHISLDHPGQFPRGLGGIFYQFFQRQFPDPGAFRRDVRPALRAIIAAREPLPLELLQRLLHWEDEQLRDFTRALGSLFSTGWKRGLEIIKAYHKSIPDWLTDESRAGPFFVSVAEGNRLLAEHCWQAYLANVETLGIYEARFAVEHLERAGRAGDADRLNQDKRFQKRRLESEIEATDARYHSFLKISADQADLKNELQELLNTMGEGRRWHPQQAEFYKALGAQEDYCEVHRFPCCGTFVLVGVGSSPSQYRADGCFEAPPS